jgi:hypothetical protein
MYYGCRDLFDLTDNREQILAISIYCQSNSIDPKSFGKRAKIYPGKAPFREIVQAEVAGTYTEKKPVDDVNWDTKSKSLVEGELRYGRQTGIAGPLLITGKFIYSYT